MPTKKKVRESPKTSQIATAQEWGSHGIEDFHRDAIAQGLTVKLKLPSGVTVLATRPPLMEWMVFGMVPEALTTTAERIAYGRPQSEADIRREIEAALKNGDQLRRMAAFTRDVIRWAVVRPRIKEGAIGPDEIEPAMVPRSDFMFILDWIKKGCPGVPVLTEKVAATQKVSARMDSLVNFHPGSSRGQ